MIAVPLRYRRQERGLFIQKLQHAVPSIIVLSDGIEHLSHEPHGITLAIGVAEVAVSVLVIGSVIRGLRQLRQPRAAADSHATHHHGVDWIDICLGAMLSVEAYAKFHATSHLPRPTLLLAATMLILGLTHGRLAALGDRRRELRVSADGISMPGKPFQRLALTWAEVQSVEMDDRTAVITAIDGRSKKIALADATHPKAVREAVMAARSFLEETRHAASASIESSPSAT
ncbi:MAG TPA: hypothetical protein VF491_04910 [Vicinamibacterales bacterium]|jgi:hypothetical protein